jgi:hypothetical protein
MNRFPTPISCVTGQASVPLTNNRSAGKSRSSHIRRGNKFLPAALVETCWGAIRKEGSALQRKYRRWLKRRWLKKGEQKAIIAVCHYRLRVIWSVLKKDRPYVEPDAVVRENLQRQKQVRHDARKLSEMGAAEQTIRSLVDSLLQPPQPPPSETSHVPEEVAEAEPARSSPSPSVEVEAEPPGKRPLARGVPGFRIRTALKKYSVEKDLPDPPTGAAASGTPSPPKATARERQKPENTLRTKIIHEAITRDAGASSFGLVARRAMGYSSKRYFTPNR